MPPHGGATTAAADLRAMIADSAISNEPDRYLTALLSPLPERDDLITLAAYLGEIRRIPLSVNEAALGEIRLQWWRDVLEAGPQGGLSGNPIADEMVRVIPRHDLRLDLVLAPLEAASVEFGGEAIDDGPGERYPWQSYLDNAEGAAAQLSAQILGLADSLETKETAAALTAGAHAYATIRLALRLPELAAKGRWPVPSGLAGLGDPRQASQADARAIAAGVTAQLAAGACHHLAQCRAGLQLAAPAVTLAILPASLVPAYTKALNRKNRDALCEPAQIAPLTRIWTLWRAKSVGRV